MENNTPTALILVGLPGSGKSTYTNTILDDGKGYDNNSIPYIVASSDVYLEGIAERNGLTYNDVFKDFIKEASAHFTKCVQYAIDTNMSVIVDRTNMTSKGRKGIIDRLKKTHYIKAVVFEISDEDLTINLASRPGKNIPLDVIENMRHSYSFPDSSEGINEIEVVKFNRQH